MSLSTNNRKLPSCCVLAISATYTMITVVIVAFTISLGLQMTTYLLAESPEHVYLFLVLSLLRDVSANVGGDGRTPFHMSQISKSDHGETSFRSRQQNRQLSETPRITFRES